MDLHSLGDGGIVGVSRYFQIYEHPSLIASGTQMAAWALQFTSFSLTRGQLASGSENSVGSSVQL